MDYILHTRHSRVNVTRTAKSPASWTGLLLMPGPQIPADRVPLVHAAGVLDWPQIFADGVDGVHELRHQCCPQQRRGLVQEGGGEGLVPHGPVGCELGLVPQFVG